MNTELLALYEARRLLRECVFPQEYAFDLRDALEALVALIDERGWGRE